MPYSKLNTLIKNPDLEPLRESDLSELWNQKKTEAWLKVGLALKLCNRNFVTESDYIDFIYDDCRSILAPLTKLIDKHVDPVCKKSKSFAETFRVEGNNAYKEKNFELSFYLYTNSIANAPVGECAALAYGNRSAVSFEIYKFQDCIKDIHKSLENDYPVHLRYKIFLRLAQCYRHLGNIEKCIEALRELEENLKYATFKLDSIKEHYENSLRELTQSLDNGHFTSEVYGTESIKDDELCVPTPAYGTSKDIPGASSALSIHENAELGRYVVANANIKAGDILFVEEPYCLVSSCINKAKMCSYCNAHDKILISPCENCVRMYCSDDCRDKAWNDYHRWECNGILNTFEEQIGVGHLAFRILFKGAQVNYDIKNDNDYKPVYNLVTNLDKMDLDDVGVYVVMSVTLVYYLKTKTNFFDWYTKKSNMKKELISRFLSTLAFRHLCQLQCNAHGEQFDFEGERCHRSGIYPSSCLMNHSCDSNIVNDYFNSVLIVRASRNIKKGEEVSNSYGYSYRTHLTAERQKSLKEQYYFDCRCEACTRDDLKIYYQLHHAIKCPECASKLIDIEQNGNYKCIDCQYTLPPDSFLLSKYEKACLRDISYLKKNSAVKAINLLKDCAYEDSYEFLRLYHEIYLSYEIKSQYDDSICVAKKYLELIIKEYGLYSHVTAIKMLGISSVMLQNMQHLDSVNSSRLNSFGLESLQFLNETKQRLSVFYGPWNPRMKLINQYLSKANALWDSYLRFKN
ncbi:SET and MYND domain-containing protein 4-like [Chrysoperla carnea]|uniref:SET and MYND domain-containing protein 4-like n=1 Tax=Chrysoperla carnea TaxID=189513 RepID=UPI001D08C973|nr:SET and MYND domain-containing protein 4-like [Chrysoperla carnea]